MRIQRMLQILVLAAAQAAGAMPVADLRANCQRADQVGEFRGLIQQASVMGKDDRKHLSKNVAAVGFSPAEVEQANRCTGHIYCPDAINTDGSRGVNLSAGAVCAADHRGPNGQCPADRLSTAAHAFVEKGTGRFIPGLEKCEFRNYRGHVSKLNVQDIQFLDPQVESFNPHKNVRADKLIVRLQRPIPGCDPFDVATPSDSPGEGSDVVALTHVQADQLASMKTNEPLAYRCQVTRSFSARNGGPSLYYNDCDVKPLGSGGFMLVRGADGRLKMAGMFVRIGLEKDGQPYSEEKKNFTLSVGTDADYEQLASNPGVLPNPALGRGTPSELKPASH